MCTFSLQASTRLYMCTGSSAQNTPYHCREWLYIRMLRKHSSSHTRRLLLGLKNYCLTVLGSIDG